MTNWIKKLFQNQAIRYIFFGGCTTLVNLISYAIFRHFLGIDITIANFLSISLSILFAYVVNKIFVFESRTRGIRELLVDNCVLLAECDHKFEEFKEIAVFVKHAPVEPGDPAVLTVAVVVSVFGISKFIAGEEHRCSAAAHQDGTGIADHAVTQREYIRIGGFAFLAAVPASVVVRTVGVIPAVCFIMLFVIRIQIV